MPGAALGALAAPAANAIPDGGGDGALPGADILIVDDHPENLLALETVLEPLGHPIVRAGSGAEALRKVLERDFAVILLDVTMPDLDGFETAALIRQRDRSRHTPIIFLTAVNKSDAFVFKGYSHGAVDYILKPFVPEILRAKVTVFLNLFKMRAKLKEQADKLERMNRELSRSNAELQQFAYIASHDLREPLRKMASFADLLMMRCRTLDGSAQQYARFIIDGATRLQSMIEDLLEYSRAGRPDKPAERFEGGAALAKALSDLALAVQESGARIKRGELPVIHGDFAQVTRLFQNLIGNALKFRKEKGAVIEIGAETAGAERRFFVRDNGIGIDPAYHEKIFGVFNRLHAREKYPGTGVGLAICRKIVDHHGGRIWVESRQGEGATFYFTLPGRAET